MKKIIKLTESDLVNIVKKVLTEQLANVVDTKDEIIKFQNVLINLGYDLGNSGTMKNGVDGKYGPKTKQAIINFQEKNNLTVTGKFDQATQNALALYGMSKTLTDRKKPSSNMDKGLNPLKPKSTKNFEKSAKEKTPAKDKGIFVDCIKNSPKRKDVKTINGSPVIMIDNNYFYGNGRVKTSNGEMGSYFCYEDGVKIKNDKGEKTYLETGVKTSHEETSRFSGGVMGFLRKTFPNVAEIFSTKPLTSKDFTESQKQVVFDVIQNAITKRGQSRQQGCTEYIDYSPEIDQQLNKNGGATNTEMVLGSALSDEFRIATLLGRFCYKLQPNGSYLVNDDYDFHKWSSFTVKPNEIKGMSYPEKISYIRSKTDLSYYGAIRHIGYLEHPDNAPEATKTKITLNIDPGYFAKKENSLRADLSKPNNQDSTTAIT